MLFSGVVCIIISGLISFLGFYGVVLMHSKYMVSRWSSREGSFPGTQVIVKGRDTYALRVGARTGSVEYAFAEAFSHFWGGRFIPDPPPMVLGYAKILFSNEQKDRHIKEPLLAAIAASIAFSFTVTLHVPRYNGDILGVLWCDDEGDFFPEHLATKTCSWLCEKTSRLSNQFMWADPVTKNPQKIETWHAAEVSAALVRTTVFNKGFS